MLIEIMAVLFDLKFKVFLFSSTNVTCDYKCKDAGGKMPYLHQVRVDSGRTLSMRIPIPLTESTLKKVYDIHSKIYKGDQIDRKTFPIFLQNKWGDDRSMRFFLSTEYDFKTKKWISGGKIIPNHAWAKSNQHELPFPVLEDQILFLHNKYYWHNWEKRETKSFKKDLFKVVIFSSNDPNYVKERSGFHLCKNETGPELLLSKSQLFSKYKLDEVCEKGFTIFVPKTEADFAQVMKTVDTTNLLNPFRLGPN